MATSFFGSMEGIESLFLKAKMVRKRESLTKVVINIEYMEAYGNMDRLCSDDHEPGFTYYSYEHGTSVGDLTGGK